jgi:predicted nucleotidyltransferase
MRLKREIQVFLKNELTEYLPDSKLFLFGSRANNEKRGGDIDIFIVANRKLKFMEKHKIIAKFWSKFGEQKIDLLSYTPDDGDLFFSYIKDGAVEINPD